MRHAADADRPGMMDPAGSDTPWDATIGYAFVPDAWEAAARVQSLDDDMNTSVDSAVLDRFVGGRAVKWAFQFDTSKNDDSALDVDVFSLGSTVAM